MGRVTADQLIQGLQVSNPDLYNTMYLMNKDLQDARKAIDSIKNILTQNTSPQPPSPSNNAQGIIYFDPVTLKFMVSENGSPYDYLVQNAPACFIQSSVGQSVNNDSYTQLTFAASDVVADLHGLFTVSSGKITFNAPGFWLVGALVAFQSVSVNNPYWIFVRIDLNGVAGVVSQTGGAPGIVDTSLIVSANMISLLKINASDYITTTCVQVSSDSAARTTLRKSFFAIRVGGSG